MAWEVVEARPENLATEVQAFADESGTSSIDNVYLTAPSRNDVVALIDYTAA